MKTQHKPSWLLKSGMCSCWILLRLFLPVTALAQPVADPQDQAARTFVKALLTKDYDQAMKRMDPEAQKNTTPQNLVQLARATDSLAKEYGPDLLEFMQGFRTYQTGQTIWVHTYRFRGDITKGMMPATAVDIAFRDRQTTLIYGIAFKYYAHSQPTSSRVSTSTGEEIALENEQEWLVAGKTVRVNELALVLDNTTALFAIKVWDEEAKGISQQRAKEKAIPIVKYAVANGYIPKAEQDASRVNRKLSEGIGVAFIQPGTHGGYRIIIAPSEYETDTPKR